MSLRTWAKTLYLLIALLMILSLVVVPVVASAQTSGKPATKTSSVRIFLVAIGDNGKTGTKVGCGDSMVAVQRSIAPTTAPLTAAIRLTISNHKRMYGQSGLYNALYQSRLQLKRAAVVNGSATIALTGRLTLGGECDTPRVRAQLRKAALQFHTVHRVFITLNGIPLAQALSSK